MAKKRTPADVFFPMVALAAKESPIQDCLWVSRKLAEKGYVVSANSVYQRIRQMNSQLDDAGKDPCVPNLKENKHKSGAGVRKLNLDDLAGFFTTVVPAATDAVYRKVVENEIS